MCSSAANIELNCLELNQNVQNASMTKPLENCALIDAILAEIGQCNFAQFKNADFYEMPQEVLTILSLFSGPFNYGFLKLLDPSVGLQKE